MCVVCIIPVAERVLNHQHKLYDVPLTVVRHVLPQAIEVYPINGLDLESLELYFDSKKHSNGGYVTSCHAERGVAIIHFEDFESRLLHVLFVCMCKCM